MKFSNFEYVKVAKANRVSFDNLGLVTDAEL